MANGQCYEKIERYGSNPGRYFSNSNYSRKKNNSFSNFQTQERIYNSVNYYSDNASSSVSPNNEIAKKYKQRRSHSSSPILSSHYAGAKFSEPPSPNVLPLPPSSWTESSVKPRAEPAVNLIKSEKCTNTPIFIKLAPVNLNQSVELFFKKCSFNQLETCKDFTKQLKTLLNVPA